jgi:hypothetical protein
MIFYNITFFIDKEILPEGVAYIKDEFIPSAKAWGLTDPCMKKALFTPGDEASSYAVQFRAQSIGQAHEWAAGEEQAMRRKLGERFGSRILHCSTILEEISLAE